MLGTVAMFGLIGSGVAAAHVSAHVAAPAEQGGSAKITFQVPTEDATAATTKLALTLPVKYGVTSVRTRPIAGWTARIGKTTSGPDDVVTSVVWTANRGVRIGPGEFGEFDVIMSPLPKSTDTMSLPITQFYDNGTVVQWNEPTPAEGPEPEHPAPAVHLVAASAAGGDDGDGQPAPAGSTDVPDGTDGTARLLGGAGLAVGALGAGLGIGAAMRGRRPASAHTDETT